MSVVSDYCVSETLKDGTHVTIRAIRSDDRERLLAAFRLLERDTVYMRFFGPRNELSHAELDRAVTIDFVDEVALVVAVGASSDETIIASGRDMSTGRIDGKRIAEVAFVVEEDWQGRGIASELLADLGELARRQGFEQFEAEVLRGNEAMLGVFRRSAFPVQQHSEGGVIRLKLNLEHYP